MNSILCAIDFSESSVSTLLWAADLAATLELPLDILFTYRLSEPAEGIGILEYKRKVEQEAKQKFALIEAGIKGKHGLKYNFHVEVGFLPDRVKSHQKVAPHKFLVISNSMADQLLSGRLQMSCHDLIRELNLPVLFHI